jgi:RNA polymerase sigma factor (sigma-70 family)
MEKTKMNLEKLYADNYKMVYYICLKFLKNPDDAQDMTQNVFIKAFDKIDTLSDINKFSPWVRQIANRECLNELQKKGRITAKEESLPDEELNYLEDKQKNPEDMAVEDDVRDIMLQIIDGLSMDQRIAVYLYYYQDMTVKEISQVFNCSEKTTRSRLAYARKNMKKEIEKLEDKGVKLRALNILPFLYLIFQAEAKMVYADIETIEYKAGFEQATEE